MRKRKMLLIVLITIIIILLILIMIFQNNDILIYSYKYYSDKIDDKLEDYKIVQISDFHNGKLKKDENNIIEIVKNESPDLIAITGDIIDSYSTNINIAIKLVNDLKGIAPIYYVTGNHEYRLNEKDYELLMDGLKNAGAIILNNEYTKIGYKNSYFYLIGLNDKSLSDGTLNILKNEIGENKLNILLAHEPQYFEKYAKCNMDLILSGHAHGGQIRLPLIGGLFAPGQGFLPRYTLGDYHINNSTMIVSRGLGNSIFPFRVFNNPEIVSITLI